MEAFKRNLRADLLQKAAYQQASHSLGFIFASALASAFATLLVLFILKPEYPQQIRAWIDGAPIQAPSLSEPQLPEQQLRQIQGSQAMVPTYLPSEEIDRQFVKDLFKEKFSKPSPQLQKTINEGVYSIREFISEDGKRVLVYTKINDSSNEETINVSY